MILLFSLCVLGAASVSAQDYFDPPIPTLYSRSETFDDGGKFTSSYHLSGGTIVQESGSLQPNKAKDGHVLIKRGSFRFPGPYGMFWETEWLADENGYQIIRSNAVPLAPIDEAHRTS